MGLLGFIGKKSHSDLKACGYDSTVALSPPILGTYPVPGNGAKILEQFQKAHLGVSSTCSTPQPRHLSEVRKSHDGGRPNSAPLNQDDAPQSPTSLPSQPPVDKRPGPYRLPPRALTDIQTTTLNNKNAAWPASPSTYSSSIRSGESSNAKAYVDLLEAQSKIKPVGFYDHIQKTGSKIYSEDGSYASRGDRRSICTSIQDLHSHLSNGSNHSGSKRSSFVSRHADDDADDHHNHHNVNDDVDDDEVGSNVDDDAHDHYTSQHEEDEDEEEDHDEEQLVSWPPRVRTAAKQERERVPDSPPVSPKRITRAATARDFEVPKPQKPKKRQTLMTPRDTNKSRQKSHDYIVPSSPLLKESSTSGSRRSPSQSSGSNAHAKRRSMQRSASHNGASSSSHYDLPTPRLSRQSTYLHTPDMSRECAVERRLSDDFFLPELEEDSLPKPGIHYDRPSSFLDAAAAKARAKPPSLPLLFERPGPTSGGARSRAASKDTPSNSAGGNGLIRMPAYFEDSDGSIEEPYQSDYSDQGQGSDNPMSRIVSVPRHVRGQERFLASRKASSKIGNDASC